MTEPLPRRRPEDLTVVERLNLAMGRAVDRPPTEDEMREYYAKLRRAKEASDRRNGVARRPDRPDSPMQPPDDGLNAVERLALAMGRPVPPPPTEQEWRAFTARLKAAEDEAERLHATRGEAAA
jgi:hypothetical protein